MSKKNLIRPQYEEFWDDCIKLSPKKNTKFNEEFNYNNKRIIMEIQKNNNNKIIFRQNNNSVKSKNNHRLIKKVLTTEESLHKSIEKRKQKQINILTSLYNKHILKKKKAENETNRLRENLKLKEKKDCPFKPKNYSKHRSISERYFKYPNNKKKIYERGQEYKDKLYIKLKKIKHATHKKDNEEFPFQPEVTHNNFRRILYGNNFWEELANNLSNEIFLRRYKKAREEENEKRKKLIFNFYNVNESVNEESNNNNNKKNKKIHKSISQKSSLLYRKTLHNYLLEYETNDEDSSNEDKKNINNNLINKNIKIVKN